MVSSDLLDHMRRSVIRYLKDDGPQDMPTIISRITEEYDRIKIPPGTIQKLVYGMANDGKINIKVTVEWNRRRKQ